MNDWFDAEQHVERAHELYEAGRWDEAETELREALALNPYRAEWHFNLGLTLEAAGRWEHAIRAFRDAHALEPRDYQTTLLIGVNSLRVDQPTQAIEWLTHAQANDTTRADPFVYRIEAYARLNDHEQAELMFYRALQLDGDHALAYANMAESLIDRGLYDRAVYCLREAASLDPTLARIHARLGQAYAETGRYERARQLFLRELRDNPGDVDTLLDLGCLLVQMNRLAEAGEKMRRVLELDSDCVDAHYYLSDLAVRQQRWKDAIAGYRLVLRLDPNYPEVRRRLARLLIDEDEVGQARRLLRAELLDWRRSPANLLPDDLDDLGRLLLDVRLPKEAARVFAVLTDKRPQDASAWHHLGLAMLQTGDRAIGVAACKRAIRIDANHVSALHNLALAHLQDRKWSRARSYVKRALRVTPDDPALKRLRLTLKLQRFGATMLAAARFGSRHRA